MFVEGKPVQLASVDDARGLGIECVYQDLALVNGLSIYHNMFLNRELLRRGPLRLLDHREMRRRAAEALAEIGVDVPSVYRLRIFIYMKRFEEAVEWADRSFDQEPATLRCFASKSWPAPS